jgi:sec-independent protein translocase protein TatA
VTVFEGAFSPLHWLIVLAIAVLIFGPSKLPEIGKNLDTAIRGFREALSETSKPGAAPDSKTEKESLPPAKSG